MGLYIGHPLVGQMTMLDFASCRCQHQWYVDLCLHHRKMKDDERCTYDYTNIDSSIQYLLILLAYVYKVLNVAELDTSTQKDHKRMLNDRHDKHVACVRDFKHISQHPTSSLSRQSGIWAWNHHQCHHQCWYKCKEWNPIEIYVPLLPGDMIKVGTKPFPRKQTLCRDSVEMLPTKSRNPQSVGPSPYLQKLHPQSHFYDTELVLSASVFHTHTGHESSSPGKWRVELKIRKLMVRQWWLMNRVCRNRNKNKHFAQFRLSDYDSIALKLLVCINFSRGLVGFLLKEPWEAGLVLKKCGIPERKFGMTLCSIPITIYIEVKCF